MAEPLHVQTIVSLPFEENSYVVWRAGRPEALVIDPGLEPELILNFLSEQRLRPAALLNTHGHADHIGGNAALKEAYPEAPLLTLNQRQPKPRVFPVIGDLFETVPSLTRALEEEAAVQAEPKAARGAEVAG